MGRHEAITDVRAAEVADEMLRHAGLTTRPTAAVLLSSVHAAVAEIARGRLRQMVLQVLAQATEPLSAARVAEALNLRAAGEVENTLIDECRRGTVVAYTGSTGWRFAVRQQHSQGPKRRVRYTPSGMPLPPTPPGVRRQHPLTPKPPPFLRPDRRPRPPGSQGY
jgi:hypothetical protein